MAQGEQYDYLDYIETYRLYHMTKPTDGTDFNGTNDSVGEYDYYEWLPEQKALQGINLYMSPFLLFCGTFGNILSLLVLKKLCREVSSTCSYLAMLTVADMLLLYTRCGNDWLMEVIHVDISNILMVHSESICKVYPFLYNFFFHMSRWLLVAMAIEGFIATRYPHWATQLCTLSRAKAIMLLLTVLLVCINVHYFWSFQLVKMHEMDFPSSGIMCTFSKYNEHYSEEFQTIIWPLIDLLVAEVLPDIVIVVCGGSMLVLIIRGRHRGSASHQRWRMRYHLDPSALDHLKLTFLLVCVCHIILTSPKLIFDIFRYMMEKTNAYDPGNQTRWELARSVCSMLQYIFLSCKFFLYAASCRKFRQEVQRLLCCACHNKVHNPQVLVSRPLMKKESSTCSSLNINSSSINSGAHKWRNMENAELESPILCTRGTSLP